MLSWILVVLLVLVLGVVLAVRHLDARRLESGLAEIARAKTRGSHAARLQYPHVDLSRCIGCGICVTACPEDGVLDLVHGQALVVHGARCVGHGRCAAECPVGAVALTLGDLAERRDIPVLTDALEAPDAPGLYLAGEVTGYALVRTAIEHGRRVADEVAARAEPRAGEELDLAIVGAGPAGISCSLRAKERGLTFVTIEQSELGGTVAKYPRRKLVLTQPVELPLHGRLDRTSYLKEELVELWTRIAAQHELPIRTGARFEGALRRPEGGFLVRTSAGPIAARSVCLALGRRGTPRRLGVPGEDLPKVLYSLVDAESYQGRRVLVVGGGDSAVEAAMGLAEQPGNRVTLSYRKHAFFRLKARNEARLGRMVDAGELDLLLESQVTGIGPEHVELTVGSEGSSRTETLANDEVFVMVGGTPPFPLLEESGVSFDPARRPEGPSLADRGTGLTGALAAAFALGLVTLAWTFWFRDYYGAEPLVRIDSARHDLLRPASGVGLACGVAALALMTANLAYLARRSQRIPFAFGSLRRWMTGHVATGLFALLCAVVHSALAPGDTVGGHALAGLAVLVVTGAVGRYLYAFVPRAANGRELALDEVGADLASLSAEWDRVHRGFGEHVRAEVQALVADGRWRGSFLRRIVAVVGGQRALGRTLARLEREGRERGVAEDQLAALLALARRAHRSALMATHYEELRGVLATWRYLHRWVALLVVLLVVLHVAAALRYADLGVG